MVRLLAVSLVAVLALGTAAAPAEARTVKAKEQRGAQAKQGPAPRRTSARATRELTTTGYEDRSAIYHANGRLNGRALFDSISDRTSGAGE